MSDLLVQPTHGELLRHIEQIGRDVGLLTVAQQRIEGKVDGVARTVGWTGKDEKGDLIGEGLAGELARLTHRVDVRFTRDDLFINTWRGRIVGAAAATTLLIAVLWWALSPKLEALLR